MNGVRVYMRAGWSRDEGIGTSQETRDVTILEYQDAHYTYNVGWLKVYRVDDEIATFPAGDWAGVERF